MSIIIDCEDSVLSVGFSLPDFKPKYPGLDVFRQAIRVGDFRTVSYWFDTILDFEGSNLEDCKVLFTEMALMVVKAVAGPSPNPKLEEVFVDLLRRATVHSWSLAIPGERYNKEIMEAIPIRVLFSSGSYRLGPIVNWLHPVNWLRDALAGAIISGNLPILKQINRQYETPKPRTFDNAKTRLLLAVRNHRTHMFPLLTERVILEPCLDPFSEFFPSDEENEQKEGESEYIQWLRAHSETRTTDYFFVNAVRGVAHRFGWR